MSVPIFDWRRALRGHLNATQHHVALHLSDWMNPDGTNAYPSTETLAATMGRKRHTVERALGELVEAGWLGRVRPSRRESYRYWTSLPSWYPTGSTESVLKGIDSGSRVGPVEDPSWSPSGSELVPSGRRVGTEGDHDLPIDLPSDLPTDRDGLASQIRTVLAGRLESLGLWARVKTETGTPAHKLADAINTAASLNVDPHQLTETVTGGNLDGIKVLSSVLAHRIREAAPQLEGTNVRGRFEPLAMSGTIACRWCSRGREDHDPEVCARARREVAA